MQVQLFYIILLSQTANFHLSSYPPPESIHLHDVDLHLTFQFHTDKQGISFITLLQLNNETTM